MTFEEVKKLLEDIKHIKRLCIRIKREINEVRSDYGALTSQLGNISEVHTHNTTPTAQRLIERLEDKQERFEEELSKFMELEDRLAEAMKTLPPIERDIITGYYMENRTHDQLARECGYCERQVRRIKNKTVNKLSKSIKDVRPCPH